MTEESRRLGYTIAAAVVASTALNFSLTAYLVRERRVESVIMRIEYETPTPAYVYAPPPEQPSLVQIADAAADLCGTPRGLFRRLIARESSWRPGVVSSAGAVGLAQVKPSTARELGEFDLYDPFQNTLAGACYLRKQYDRFGSWERAVMAYRVGPAGLQTLEAKKYVAHVMEGL